MSASGDWRGRLRRWRWLIAAIVLVLAIRIALPEILRRVAISQASQNLRARIDLGNVDLYLWRGGVVLEDFALRPVGPGEDPAAPPPENLTPQPPIVAFKKLALGLSFRPLWNKTAQLYEVALEAPQIALDRLADGQLNVMSILPKDEQAAAAASPTPTPAETIAAEGGWRFGIDRLAIGTGKLVFRDLMVEGSEPVEVGIPSIEVRDIALDPQVYGGPLESKVKILLDEGSIELGAKLALTPESATLDAQLEAQNLPLRRSRLYVPDVGWSDLRGLLDASLHYQLETGARNEVRGNVSLRDVAISVPQLPEAALWWKSLSVSVDPIDLQNQNAHVTSVALDGAVFTVEPHSADQLPVLARRAKAAAKTSPPAVVGTPPETPIDANASPPPAESTPSESPLAANAGATPVEPEAPSSTAIPVSSETPTATPAESASPASVTADSETPAAAPAAEASPAPTPEGEAVEAKPWEWSVDSVQLTETLVRLLSPDAPLDIGLVVDVKNLDGKPETAADVDVHLTAGDGTIAVQGQTRIAPPGFGGKVVIANLSVPQVIAASGALKDSPLLAALLTTDLAVSAGLAAPGAPALGAHDLQVSGKIGVAELRVAPPGMTDAEVGAQTVDIVLAPLELPGILAPPAAEGSAAVAGRGDLRLQGEIALGDARVALAAGKDLLVGAKNLRLVMTKLELPGLLAPPPAEGAPSLPGKGDLRLQGELDIADANVATGEGKDLEVDAKSLHFAMTNLELPGLLAPPAAEGAPVSPGKGDLRLQGVLDVGDASVATAAGKDLNVGVKNVRFAMTKLELPGALAPPPAAGTPVSPDKGDFRLQGELALTDTRIAKGDGKDLLIGAKNLKLAMSNIDLPGLLLSPPPAVAATKQIALRELTLEAPLVRVTRTESGLVLPGPQPSPGASPPPTAPAEAKAAETAPTPAAAPPTPLVPPPLVLALDAFRLTKGKVEIEDRAVKPPFKGGLDAIDVSARDIRFPETAVKQLKFKARTGGSGEISIAGDLSPSGGEITIDGRKVDLPSYNPYASTYSPFRIGGGALSLSTKLKYKGDTYDIGNSLTLHQLDLTGKEGDSLFEQNFGVPLSTALALLRDAQGDIAMDIPLQVDKQGTKVDIVGIAGGALRRALVNALTSPLRLLGAVGGSGDKVESIAPAAIAFRPGRAEPVGEGEKRLEQVGAFLASRPSLGIELSSQPTQRDARWLREQALLATWDEEGFFASMVAKVSGGDARERIQQALVARRNGEPGKLSDEDAKMLDEWLAEHPDIPAEQLEALAAARLELARAAIGRKVDAARIQVISPSQDLSEGDPQVGLKLEPLGDGTDDESGDDAG